MVNCRTQGVGRGLKPGERVEVAEILYDAFKNKFSPVLGSKEDVVSFISKYLNPSRLITAECEGKVVGVAGLKYLGDTWLKPNVRELLKSGKWLMKLIRAALVGLPLLEKAGEGELLIDVLAVHPDFRGLGIGTEIVGRVVELAKSVGLRVIKLYVVADNVRALRFYKRLGFTKSATIKMPPPWSTLLKFRVVYELRKYV